MTLPFAGWRRASGAEGLGHSGGPLHCVGGVRGLHHGGHGEAPREDHVRRGRPQRHAEACMSGPWDLSRLPCVPCTQPLGSAPAPFHFVHLFFSFACFPLKPLCLSSIFVLSQEDNGQIKMGVGELAFGGSGCPPVSFRALFS